MRDLMPASLDLSLVRRLAESFPNEGWQTIKTRAFVADRSEQFFSDWSHSSHVTKMGGVYAVLLPCAWFTPTRTILLHAPHTHHQPTIPYEFTLQPLDGSLEGVVYIGRTSNLAQRWRGHLSRGERKDGGQVKFGLMDCGLHLDLDEALRSLRTHAHIVYTVLPGPENCANRDVLEMSLCARFAPPFNIKSER
jgi:hypothetical protein